MSELKQMPLPLKTEETKDGKTKIILGDSYALVEDNQQKAVRYFPDGKTQTYLWLDNWSPSELNRLDLKLDRNKTEFILESEILPGGLKIEYSLYGRTKSQTWPNGRRREWENEGMMNHEYLPDGTERTYAGNELCAEKIPGGVERHWYFCAPEERIEASEDLPDGTKHSYFLSPRIRSEKLPDGTEHGYYDSKDNDLKYEKFPNGREVTWSLNYTSYRIPGLDKLPDGMYKERKSSDGIKMIYNEKNEVIYHFTNDVEDTDAWLAKERIKAKKEKNMSKFEGKPKIIREVANKIASSKTFNDIAFKVALQKVKKSSR